MLDRQCPRVVETREPATETTLEDDLARNLSIRSTHARAYAGFGAVVVQVQVVLSQPRIRPRGIVP